MTPKEQTRLQVLNSLLVERMTLDQAATLMGVSPRHTRRILADYRKNGAASLAHGHRGRKPANAIPEATRSRVVHLARTVYEGANHTHLSELLSERVGLDMGRTTLRRILVNAGLSSPRRRRPPKHRVRRQRMPRQGMLIQMDGSHHPWLGDRMLPFTLLIAVDDATGTVVDALFCEKEDAHSYFLLIQRLLQRRGIPLALYTDRHGVFRHTPGSGLPGPGSSAAYTWLRADVKNDIFGAYGIPSSIHGTGGSARESYRQFLASTILPLAKMVLEELALKLDMPNLALDWLLPG